MNVIIWSWCGQAAGYTEADDAEHIPDADEPLEAEYPGVKFVYMTGHLDGTGPTGNLNQRNQQIRDYCSANNKILYDFADIESYDPDGLVNYMHCCQRQLRLRLRRGRLGGRNWAPPGRAPTPKNVDWYECAPAHSQPLNGNLKAYAAWWLWARWRAGPTRRGSGWPTPVPLRETRSAHRVPLSRAASSCRHDPVSFQASLSAAIDQTVTVKFTTVAGTATGGRRLHEPVGHHHFRARRDDQVGHHSSHRRPDR